MRAYDIFLFPLFLETAETYEGLRFDSLEESDSEICLRLDIDMLQLFRSYFGSKLNPHVKMTETA